MKYIPLTANRKLMLAGYLCLLEQAAPNGRVAHEVANIITGLRGSIQLDIDVMPEYEDKIKRVVRILYPDDKINA